MRALMALALVASVAGCEQPEGAPTTNGEENLGDSQVAGGTVNVSNDPGASAPEIGADGTTDEASTGIDSADNGATDDPSSAPPETSSPACEHDENLEGTYYICEDLSDTDVYFLHWVEKECAWCVAAFPDGTPPLVYSDIKTPDPTGVMAALGCQKQGKVVQE